jgi:cell division transport system ATP-binding protein
MIEFYNVSLRSEHKQILDNVSFRLFKGEFAYLVGPSGAGKSTILKLIYMDLFPDQGMVVVNNYSSAKIKRNEIPFLRRELGVVFQDFQLLNDRNVYENVAFALRATGVKNKEIKQRVVRVLNEVNIAKQRFQLPDEISGGEKQRVAIARAIVNDPFIVLADEPTGNLDAKTSRQIMDIFERINQKGTAILMATHDQALIKEYPHRVIYIEQGKIISE